MRFTHSSILLVSLFLCACGQPAPTFPAGVQTVQGTLQRAELKADRRGTHVLIQNGKPVTYVESRSGSLLDSEGYDVSITGTFEANRDPNDLPVLVVQKVQKLLQTLHQWSVPRLQISLSTPPTWQMKERDDRAIKGGKLYTDFIDMSPGVTPSVALSLWTLSGTTLPAGTPMTIGGKTAVRSTAGSGVSYAVLHGSSLLMMGFVGTLPHIDQILSSVSFTDSPSSIASSAASKATGTGAVVGQPCGGIAGIICPAGQYCAIADKASNSGRCQGIH